MFSSVDQDEIKALLTELHLLIQEARARGDLHVKSDGFLPDYWYGVATGYQDAAARLEALLQRSPNQVGITHTQQSPLEGLRHARDNDNDDRPDADSSLFLPVFRSPKE